MDKIWWYAAHILAIGTHFGLFFAGALAFVGSGMSSRTGGIDLDNFDYQKYYNSFEDSHYMTVLAWGTGVVGIVGCSLNVLIFSALRKADIASGRAAHFQRQIITIVATCVAMGLVVGEIILAKALGRQGSTWFGLLCGVTSLASASTALSVIADIVKLYTFDQEDAEEDSFIWQSQRIQLE